VPVTVLRAFRGVSETASLPLEVVFSLSEIPMVPIVADLLRFVHRCLGTEGRGLSLVQLYWRRSKKSGPDSSVKHCKIEVDMLVATLIFFTNSREHDITSTLTL
jgi:hypothetical protein